MASTGGILGHLARGLLGIIEELLIELGEGDRGVLELGLSTTSVAELGEGVRG